MGEIDLRTPPLTPYPPPPQTPVNLDGCNLQLWGGVNSLPSAFVIRLGHNEVELATVSPHQALKEWICAQTYRFKTARGGAGISSLTKMGHLRGIHVKWHFATLDVGQQGVFKKKQYITINKQVCATQCFALARALGEKVT